jgi:hypothetical protein
VICDRRQRLVPAWLSNLCNRINDADLTWVGFRALRPAPHQDMTTWVVATLCAVYCPLSAAAGYAIAYLVVTNPGGRRAPPHLPWIVAAAAALVFLLLQCLLARAWNVRAAQLRAEKRA